MGSTKSDMDRVGLFQELGYLGIGDSYVSRGKFAFNESASKGKQMVAPTSKTRCALQDGYFDKTFARVFEGEGYSDPLRRRRLNKIDATKLNITTTAYMPTSFPKDICGLGNWYGSFSGQVEAFSPSIKVIKDPRTTLKNILTNPGKKGTGYGYQNVTIGKYPVNMSEPYSRAMDLYKRDLNLHKTSLKGGPFRLNMHPRAYFHNNPYIEDDKVLPPKKVKEEKKTEQLKSFKHSSPGKPIAGDKSGAFEKYPTHSNDVYNPRLALRPVNVVNNSGKLFYPNYFYKSRPTNSVMQQNVTRGMNVQNYQRFKAMTASF